MDNTQTINGFNLNEIAIQHIDAVVLEGTRTKVYLHIVQPFIASLKDNKNLIISVYDPHQPRIDLLATRETLDNYKIDAIYHYLKEAKENGILKRGIVQAFTFVPKEV